MIPKVIHYCWFGNNDISPLSMRCIETWKKYLPDYKIILWNEENCPRNEFIDYHLKKENWAFVSDYVRLYALYNHGGIYLDTDVEIVKNFDFLLSKKAFVAYEDQNLINNAICGTQKDNIFFYDCMNYINERHDKKLYYHISPIVTTAVLKEKKYDIEILPSEYFYPYNPYDKSRSIKIFMMNMITENTYAIHHWAKSWHSDNENIINYKLLKYRIKKYIRHFFSTIKKTLFK